MKRILIDVVAEGPRLVRDAGYHHLARVLRVRVGDEIVVFDGEGREAEARVTRIWPTEILLNVGSVRAAPAAPVAITLILALLKGDKMDLVVQKATELGVARIVPVTSAHAVVKLDAARRTGRHERWAKIAAEAARQCGRAGVPEVTEVRDLAAALAVGAGWRVLFHEAERDATVRRVQPRERPAEVTVAVGPEGGFAPDEVAAARASGYAVCGLGPRVLRAETAAIIAVALIGFAFGDLG
jgi:16S rRNA (uracil1498-N3)-methyltransferase